MKTKEEQTEAEKACIDSKLLSKDEFVKAVRDAEKGAFFSVEESKKMLSQKKLFFFPV
jgi:hypothetical protein